MTRQEQIEEMAKKMPEKIKDPLDNSRYIIFGKSLRREIARIYYNAGYRKVGEAEIEQLKAENEELSKVVSSKVYDLIDNTKEIADAREAWEQQAKIDVLNELWEKVKDKGVDYKIGMRALSEEIDELIKEIENADKD